MSASLNPALAPRMQRCVICREVTAIEDVTWRLFTEEGFEILHGTKAAAEYLRSIGMTGTPQAIYNRLVTHRKHVAAWLNRQHVIAQEKGIAVAEVAPMQGDGGVVRIPPPSGPARWLDVNANAMSIGNDALAEMKSRLDKGLLEDKEILALAKIGVQAAHKRGDLEAKGKALSQIDRLLEMASGLRGGNE